MKKLQILLLFISFAPLVKAQCVLPDAAGPIQGNTEVCPVNGEQTYSIAPVNNATSYNWSIEPSLPLTLKGTEVQVDFSTATPFTYTLTIEPKNSCGAGLTSTLEVTVMRDINPSFSLPDISPLCFGEEVTWGVLDLNGTGGVNPTIKWYVGGVLQNSNNDTFSTTALREKVTVAVTTNYECSSNPTVSASVIPYIVNPPAPVLSIREDEFCEVDGPYDLSVDVIEDTNPSVDYTYRWFRDDALIQITTTKGSYPVNTSGEYRVEVTNNICANVGSDEQTVTVYELPIVDAGPGVVVLQGEEGFLQGSTSVLGEIVWNIDGSNPEFTTDILNLENPNWYETSFQSDTLVENLPISLTVVNGLCLSSDFTLLSIIESPSDEVIFAYPNITSNKTTIALKKSGVLSVWDIQGVFYYQLLVSKGMKELDFSFLPSGQYIVRLNASDGSAAETKVIKQ